MKSPVFLLLAALAASATQAESWVSVGASPKAAPANSSNKAIYSSQEPLSSESQDSGQIQLIAELVDQVQQLQSQVSRLSGQLESQNYQIEQLRKNSDARYLDVDRRLSDLVLKQNSSPVTEPETTQSTVKADAKDDQQVYQSAMALLRSRDYDGAKVAFDDFIRKYPDSDLLQNALYWSGAVASFQQDFAVALERYQSVMDRFPNGLKAPDAMYGYGVAMHLSGNADGAREWLEKGISDYAESGSNAVTKAKDYLKTHFSK